MLETVVTYQKHFAETTSFVCHWERALGSCAKELSYLSTENLKSALEMAKRKVDTEKRNFQNRWDDEYMFTHIVGKPVFRICRSSTEVIKEFTLRRHYETKHQEVLNNLNMEQTL